MLICVQRNNIFSFILGKTRKSNLFPIGMNRNKLKRSDICKWSWKTRFRGTLSLIKCRKVLSPDKDIIVIIKQFWLYHIDLRKSFISNRKVLLNNTFWTVIIDTKLRWTIPSVISLLFRILSQISGWKMTGNITKRTACSNYCA